MLHYQYDGKGFATVVQINIICANNGVFLEVVH